MKESCDITEDDANNIEHFLFLVSNPWIFHSLLVFLAKPSGSLRARQAILHIFRDACTSKMGVSIFLSFDFYINVKNQQKLIYNFLR